jgi:hypothetical protein
MVARILRASIIATGILCLCCVSPSMTQRTPPPATATSPNLEFTVGNSADSSMLLPGVAVSVVTTAGDVIDIGRTDRFGQVTVPKSLLDPGKARLVMFCHKAFFCGAVLADEPQADLRRWDEYFVTLAPVVVR